MAIGPSRGARRELRHDSTFNDTHRTVCGTRARRRVFVRSRRTSASYRRGVAREGRHRPRCLGHEPEHRARRRLEASRDDHWVRLRERGAGGVGEKCVADPKIHVDSTAFVSSTQLTATIDIAPDATIDLYDVSVTNPDKKKGIGYLLFEVTQATAIAGTEIAYGATDAGEVTGRVGVPGVFYFSSATGLVTLGSAGRGFDISADGRTIVGGITSGGADTSYVYTFGGSGWTRTDLPKDSGDPLVRARSVASDPTTGAAVLIGGNVSFRLKGNTLTRQPRLWMSTSGGWTLVQLAIVGTEGIVWDVSPTGIAVGSTGDRAAAWAPNGSGGWTVPALVGPTGSELMGVNTTGTIAVGTSGGHAAYWTNSGAGWSAPFVLPGGCTSAAAVDDRGRIVGNDCQKGSRRVPAVIAPPYGAGDITLLGGLGDSAGTASAEDISRGGNYIVGQATVQGQPIGVYWRVP